MQDTRPSLDATRVSGLLRAYVEAEYRWQRDGSWHDIVIGLPAPGLELAYPEATSFGLLSAWNPHSVERGIEDNRRDDDRLQEALSASGCRFLPAFASAPNRSWREPSWLVFNMTSGDFDALARRYGQLGTLWWQSTEPVRLRMISAKPQGLADEPYVDWIE